MRMRQIFLALTLALTFASLSPGLGLAATRPALA